VRGPARTLGLEPGEACDFVRTRLCDFSLRCFEEPILLPANRKASVPATYVACVAENCPARPFFKVFADKARDCGWDVAELNPGDDCHAELSNGQVKSLIFCWLRRNREEQRPPGSQSLRSRSASLRQGTGEARLKIEETNPLRRDRDPHHLLNHGSKLRDPSLSLLRSEIALRG